VGAYYWVITFQEHDGSTGSIHCGGSRGPSPNPSWLPSSTGTYYVSLLWCQLRCSTRLHADGQDVRASMWGNNDHSTTRQILGCGCLAMPHMSHWEKHWRAGGVRECTLQCFILGIMVNSPHVILYIVTPIGAWILQANHGIVGIFYWFWSMNMRERMTLILQSLCRGPSLEVICP